MLVLLICYLECGSPSWMTSFTKNTFNTKFFKVRAHHKITPSSLYFQLCKSGIICCCSFGYVIAFQNYDHLQAKPLPLQILFRILWLIMLVLLLTSERVSMIPAAMSFNCCAGAIAHFASFIVALLSINSALRLVNGAGLEPTSTLLIQIFVFLTSSTL